ncbi:MAG: DNA translocase FtsK 4TM domain-containing protein [Phycisphaerae bacterium]|nr:DNA translocase FtsK 4TM domain-containing protein [Phycisphaerae bacterium]
MSDSHNQIHRIAISCIGLGLCLFAAISLFSFDIQDPPNPDFANESQVTNNLCGPSGAFLAYKANYYIGTSSMLIVMAIMVWFVLYCMKRPMEQLFFRVTGLLIIVAVWAAAEYWIYGGDNTSLSQGHGGILGIALTNFLKTHTAEFGTVLILSAAAIVGLLLAVDNIVFMLPKLLIQIVENIQKAGPVLSSTKTTKTNPVQKVKEQDDQNEDSEEEEEEEFEQEEFEFDEELDESDLVDEDEQENPEPVKSKKRPKPAPRNMSNPAVSALAKMLGHKQTSKPTSGQAPVANYDNYKYPPMDLLAKPQYGYLDKLEDEVKDRAVLLEKTLTEFKLDTKVVSWETGPVITMFELKLAPGIKVSQITRLANDMARSLGSATVRVVAPLPGRHTIGIEVPNSSKEMVRVKELIQLSGDRHEKMQIPLFLGKDATGEPLIEDLAAMPHCLIAGTTGSGKSVCINSIITSILLTQRPDMVKLILVDPKMVEMNGYSDLAHLMCPIVTEMKKAEQILEWLTCKMDQRYSLLSRANVRNIVSYNKLTPEQIYERIDPKSEEEKARTPERLPYMVVIIDELADLMMTAGKEIEGYIVRLAQKSRAVGIHLVLATQRPQATVVTGLIKSNMPCRISFRVASRMDSRIVLDSNGAESLLGQGDMLFLKPGTSELLRCQGTYLGDNEINDIVKYLKDIAQPSYNPELMQMNTIDAGLDMERDDLFDDAVRIVLETRRGSVSLLQRRLTIGYSRASRLVEQMAAAGILGEYNGGQPRDVMMSLEEYNSIRMQMQRDADDGYEDMAEDDDDPADDSLETEDQDQLDSDDAEALYEEEEEEDDDDDDDDDEEEEEEEEESDDDDSLDDQEYEEDEESTDDDDDDDDDDDEYEEACSYIDEEDEKDVVK